MSARFRRHAGNYAAALLVLFGIAIGVDALLVHLHFRPLVGCLLRPAFQLLLGRTGGTGLMTLGALLLVPPATRRLGVELLLAGIVIGLLPGLIEGQLGPLCRAS